jgi:dual specificity phosphatase 3
MDTIARVLNNLWVGGDAVYSTNLSQDLKVIRNVDLILDARTPEERAALSSWSDIDMGDNTPLSVGIDLDDDADSTNDDPALFVRGLSAVEEVADRLDKRAEEVKVFVHCHMGVNRSPSLAMFLMMTMWGMGPDRAFLLLRESRPQAFIAYAEQAVRALDALYAVDEGELLAPTWKKWEDVYWSTRKNHVKGINAKIAEARRSFQGMNATYTDRLGRVHAKAVK